MRKTISIMTAGVLLSVEYVSAMEMDGHTAPTLEGEFPWRAIGATAICFAGILLAGLKNSRRSQTKAG